MEPIIAFIAGDRKGRRYDALMAIDQTPLSRAPLVFIAVVERPIFGKKCQVCYGLACYISADRVTTSLSFS